MGEICFNDWYFEITTDWEWDDSFDIADALRADGAEGPDEVLTEAAIQAQADMLLEKE